MARSHKRPRCAIYVLGAGFSVFAGLPLATELWTRICARALRMSGRAEKFREDLDDYIRFRKLADGVRLTLEDVNFEEFLGFLDIEHHLGLRGSETWSSDGNESQVIVKTLIGQVLAECLPTEMPDLYLRFAEHLQPYDTVITFNYDTLLEDACDIVGKPYRLAPLEYSTVSNSSAIVKPGNEKQIVILKMHGSIDWFDRKSFLKKIQFAAEQGVEAFIPSDPIFNADPPFEMSPLVPGPRPDGDPLKDVLRIHDIRRVYRNPPLFRATPKLINPSTSKIVYANYVSDYWNGMRYQGSESTRLVVIGYSLPPHDEYARQAIYRLVKNYQSGTRSNKEPVTIVDLCRSERELNTLKGRYRFLDWRRTRTSLSGFSQEAFTMTLQ